MGQKKFWAHEKWALGPPDYGPFEHGPHRIYEPSEHDQLRLPGELIYLYFCQVIVIVMWYSNDVVIEILDLSKILYVVLMTLSYCCHWYK